MKTGFLILNYNSWELTAKLASKVSGFKNIDLVLAVDNCSSDGSYEKLIALSRGRFTVIRSERNGGYAYGNNFGAAFCREQGVDILFISNPDVDVSEKDVGLIIDAFAGSDYAVLSGVEYNIRRKIEQPPLWKLMSYKDDLMDCFFIGRKLCKAKKGSPLDRSVKIQRAELVKGSFLAVRLDSFLKVGGFDENTFLFLEETILARRLQKAGEKLGVVTGARYYHNHSATINKAYKGVAKQMKLLYDSRLYYHQNYNRINKAQLILLKLSMRFSLLEYRLRDLLRSKGIMR